MNNLLKFQLYATAAVVAISMIEAVVLARRNRGFDWRETRLSLLDLVGRRIVQLIPLSLAGPVMSWAWAHRIHTMPLDGPAAFALLFIGQEFCYYWYHRAAHRMRFFWATHQVHHSPNQLTLSTSYRLGWTGKLTGTGMFFAPLVWLGFPPGAVFATLSINLLYQFWLHTTWIPKLGWLEYVFNTPSAHRVHHASNLSYLDRNYGGVLIIFDRLFGTYASERDEEPCVYGLVKPLREASLWRIEFHEWRSLGRDMMAARNPVTAVKLLLMPPGWAPDGQGTRTEDLRAAATPQEG
ncbi:sterol desaturase family protein [Noviherbaspirillum pedocola]|uniref:Sterol desaturase family protein n=1 Tax=Noviherbaspirillum pedocola TaxID=2801341 RepID=A0A934W1Q6_9BURK|nr:sterol desaturase family protein [Noviherbaspirillum pedocola]MBK4735461.1 sterol desaturase family protein [Noviherbaspirillum pedocola]